MNIILLYAQLMKIIMALLQVYVWIILAYCVASMAVGFGILDIRNNRFLMSAFATLVRLVEPVLRPIRAILPDMGALDLSPLILLLLIEYGIPYLLRMIFRLIYSSQGL
ncbi:MULTISPECIES: YggT family protein [unclassified Saccharibacter]|uniref:YggT family protein n=1 Tax=unclassified Saccharibacter TaxID=2648722 RepID=UPI00351B38FC